MSHIKENLILPAPIEDLINKALDTREFSKDQRQGYYSRMVAIKSALDAAIQLFNKQK